MATILLVDDNNYIIETLSSYIKQSMKNPTVLMASNGKAAADILESLPVDFVITDLQMPIMDGYALIDYRNRNFPQVPLVAMSGDTSPDALARLNALGVNECLEKPFGYDEIVRLMLMTRSLVDCTVLAI